MFRPNNNNNYYAMFEDQTLIADLKKNGKITEFGHAPKPINPILAKTANEEGYGIFFPIQETLPNRRALKDITAIRCWAIDLDNGSKNELTELIYKSPLKPSLIVETKNGFHVYFYANEKIVINNENREEMIKRYREIVEKRLVPFFRLKDEKGNLIYQKDQKGNKKEVGADGNAKDLSRMLRVPGYYHCKDNNNRFLVKVVAENGASYSEQQMLESFPVNETKPENPQEKSKNLKEPTTPSLYQLSKFDSKKGLELLSGTEAVGFEEYSFKPNSNGTLQIFVNGNSSSCWITKEGFIGSHDKGGPTLVQWLKYFGHDSKKICEITKHVFGFDNNLSEQNIANLLTIDDSIIYDSHGFYMYLKDKGVWESISNEYIGKRIIVLLNKFAFSPKNRDLDNTINFMKKYFLPSTSKGKKSVLNQNKDIFVLKNTILNLKILVPQPFNKELYSTIQVDYTYNPKAQCHRWEKFISEVLPDPKLQLLIQEIAGYCLTAETKHHKAFFLVGDGRNGKSVFLNILIKMVGKQNCSHVDYSKLEDNFGLATMVNKLLNVSSEISGLFKKETENYKKIVGGDPVEINEKHKPQYETTLFCKLVYAANSLPASADRTYGFFSKFLIIPFEQRFTEKLGNQDKDLSLKLEEELSGIFNWALTGLQRLNNQNFFTESEKSENVRHEYEKDSNNFLIFFEDTFEASETGNINAGILYKLYKEYCEENTYKPFSKRTVGIELSKFPFFSKSKINNELFYFGFTTIKGEKLND
ncbi:MAG: phage/plasmid primase, P4 family [Candidatus Margulisbacteria bacterium]|nr:phage/plasmid primase, P4 family [Candidatus Margulisiibacteriota bacterium]